LNIFGKGKGINLLIKHMYNSYGSGHYLWGGRGVGLVNGENKVENFFDPLRTEGKLFVPPPS
jgi:hypothetical protein